jgi:hypothetical protein
LRTTFLALGLTGALLCSPGSALASPAGDSIALRYAGSTFRGKLITKDPACRADRRIGVFQLRAGRDPRVGGATSAKTGAFGLVARDASGGFYARVARTNACGPARSKRVAAGIARLEIRPYGLLLTKRGDAQRLSLRAYDRDDSPIPVKVEGRFRSSAPTVTAVSKDHVATAKTSSGSAQITARAKGLTSAPILVTVARPVAGAVLIDDSRILTLPAPADANAEVGYETPIVAVIRARKAPKPGQILISSGQKPLAGRVVSAKPMSKGRFRVIYTLITTDEAFPDLEIDQKLDLSQAPLSLNPKLDEAFDVEREGGTLTLTPIPGRRAAGSRAFDSREILECGFEAQSSGGGFPLDISPPAVAIRLNPELDLGAVAGSFDRILLRIRPNVQLDLNVRVALAYEGKYQCKLTVGVFIPPIGGALAAVAGFAIPVGFGFELGGRLGLVDTRFGFKAGLSGVAEGGVIDTGGPDGWEPHATASVVPFAQPVLKLPQLSDVRLEPKLFPFAFAQTFGTAFPWLVLRLGGDFERYGVDIFEARIGPELSGSFAHRDAQISDAAYSSDYRLALLGKLEAGKRLGEIARFLGAERFKPFSFELINSELDRSPSGTLTTTKADGAMLGVGDEVSFSARLANVTFLDHLAGLGLAFYNVDRVLLVRAVSGQSPQIVDSATPGSDGQTDFDLSYFSPGGEQLHLTEFYLFLDPDFPPDIEALDSFSLELAQAQSACPGAPPRPAAGLWRAVSAPGDEQCEEIAVAIDPPSATVTSGSTRQFTATVTGTDNQAVTWSATGGTITSDGLYTAGQTLGEFTVTATSVADPTKSGTATVTITAAGGGVMVVDRRAEVQAGAGCNDGLDEDREERPTTGPYSGSWTGSASASGTCETSGSTFSASATGSQTSDVEPAAAGSNFVDFAATSNTNGGQTSSQHRVYVTLATTQHLTCTGNYVRGDAQNFGPAFIALYTANGAFERFLFDPGNSLSGAVSVSTDISAGTHQLEFVSGLGGVFEHPTSASADMHCAFDAPVTIVAH